MTDSMRLPAVDEGHIRTGRPGVIGIAAVFSGRTPDLAAIRARAVERWNELPRVSWTLRPPPQRPGIRTGASLSSHRWAAATATFDPESQVLAADEKLEPLLRTVIEQPLPADLPLWRMWLTEGTSCGGDFAVVLLAHHGLMDGRSLETLMRLLMDEPPSSRRFARTPPPSAVTIRDAGRELRRMRDGGQALPLPSPGAAEPSVAVTDLSAQVIRAARRLPAGGPDATLNELLLGSLAGALRARYGPVARWPKAPAPLHATVPVDLRSGADAHRLGNIVTALRLPLPVDGDSPADRLRACQRLCAELPARTEVHRKVLPLLEAAARPGPWVPALLARHLMRPDVTPTVCTAFKWRDRASTLHGRPLVRVIPLPQLHRPGTANLCLMQTGDTYTLTVVSNHRPGEATVLGEAVAHELEQLAAG